MNRRSLTPSPTPASGLPQRRASGARREVSDHVRLKMSPTGSTSAPAGGSTSAPAGGSTSAPDGASTSAPDRASTEGSEVEGWALNISNGGIRCIVDTDGINLDELFELGRAIEVFVGDAPGRPARIVWVQAEPDGAIVGIAFLDANDGHPPSVPPGALARPPSPTSKPDK